MKLLPNIDIYICVCTSKTGVLVEYIADEAFPICVIQIAIFEVQQ